MNIVVGYVQSNGDAGRLAGEVRTLMAFGCQTVRTEAAEAPDKLFKPVLEAVCDFLGEGDELVAPDVTHLGASPSAAESFLARLGARRARLRLLVPAPADLGLVCTATTGARRVQDAQPPILGGRIDAKTVKALSDHGFGPSQIARRLGVSRMTVWRKLASAEA